MQTISYQISPHITFYYSLVRSDEANYKVLLDINDAYFKNDSIIEIVNCTKDKIKENKNGSQ